MNQKKSSFFKNINYINIFKYVSLFVSLKTLFISHLYFWINTLIHWFIDALIRVKLNMMSTMIIKVYSYVNSIVQIKTRWARFSQHSNLYYAYANVLCSGL